MKRGSYLVTGGAGFIGSHLSERLVREGHQVICVDNFDPYYSVDTKKSNLRNIREVRGFKLVDLDLRDKKAVDSLFTDNNIRKVVHLAAQAGVRSSITNPEKYYQVNVLGTLNLLEALKKFKIEKLVLASSSSVYGCNSKIPFAETDPLLTPASPYAASKIAAESLCAAYSHLYSIPTVCLRFFTVYGPRQRPDMAIHKFVKSAYAHGVIEMYGDGSTYRDYTYIDDVIDGIISAIMYDCTFEIFNLGNSQTVNLKTLIDIIRNVIGTNVLVETQAAQAGDVPLTYADITKARQILRYDPKTSIDHGIREFVEWFKAAKQI